MNDELKLAVNEFLSECEELSARASQSLQQLDKGAAPTDILDSLYRDIHTIKGTAQLFGYKNIGDVAHGMENVLEPYRRNKAAPASNVIDDLLKNLDSIDRVLSSMRNEKPSEGAFEVTTEVTAVTTPEAKDDFATLAPLVQSSLVEPVKVEEVVAVKEVPAPMAAAVAKEVPAKEAATPAASTEAVDSSSSVRVPVSLLDKLMTLMGEMVLVRNQVLQYANQSDNLEFQNLSQRLDVVTSEIQGEVMKTRMQPIGNILSKFNRVVRDLAKELNKKLEISLFGTETELDKTLLEAVKDPIMHIVRNSCDHGIETAEERKAAGKKEHGTVSIRSYHDGGQVIVEISDDGRGLNREKLLKKAIEKGLFTAEKAAALSEREVFSLIFAPGFSTAAHVTNVSGRGVGMDVVKNNIEGIGGTVELQSQQGKGTTTRFKIPLTLAIVPAMIVRSGENCFAIPQVKLVELVRVEKGAQNGIEFLQGKPVFRLRGNILPLISLQSVLGTGSADTLPDVVNIVVLSAERQMFGLIVDEVQDTAEVVVKPLSAFLKSLLVYSGATVLGDGSVALILDVNGIAHHQKIITESNSRTPFEDENDHNSKVNFDEQEFLLFNLDSTTKHAIPLNLVHRLEEFDAKSIEFSGSQRVVRYRNSVLPLISLNQKLNYTPAANAAASGPLSVIVTQKGGRAYGIEVNEILDVLKTTAAMDDSFTDRGGILGNLISQEEVIVIVDVLQILDEFTKKAGLNSGTVVSKAAPTKSQPCRILFVEDTAFFRKHVTSVLERAGHQVTCAVNGAIGLSVLEQSDLSKFDLVLSDIEMPEMNGLQMATAIRKNTSWKNIPMIAITTRYSPAHVIEGKEAGFDSYLEKMNAEVLLKEIGLLTSQSSSERKAS